MSPGGFLMHRAGMRYAATVTKPDKFLDRVKSAFRQLGVAPAAPPAPPVVEAAVQSEHASQSAEDKFALGRILHRSGRLAEAIGAYEAAIDARHDHVDALVALGSAYGECGRREDAADCFQLALTYEPECAAAHLGVGRLLREDGRPEEAIAHFREAASLPEEAAEGWFELGLTLERPKHAEEAEAAYRRALELRPDHPGAAVNLGLIQLAERGDPVAAEASFRRAVASDPSLAAAKVNLALSLQEQGRFDEAVDLLDHAIREHSGLPDVLWHRALARLLRGDFGDAWDDHEARRRIRGGSFERRFPYPDWQGEPLAGREILIYAEQGLGDEIMFASCVPDLIERGARCVIECDPRLVPLYARSFPHAIVHGAPRDGDRHWLERYPGIELQAAVGSLPRYLRRSRADFSQRAAYLAADPARVAWWRNRLAALGGGPAIGISWLGGTSKTRSGLRSIPLEEWAPVLRYPNVRFISLQHGTGPDAGLPAALHYWPEVLASVDETAALMAALDLIISIDNTVVHLAGALGRPACLLLPASPDWRWLWEGESVPWYPSVRAFRQARGENWAPVMAAVAAGMARRNLKGAS